MAKTSKLPGMIDFTDSELTLLAERYVLARDARMDKLKEEVDLKNLVIAKMEELKLKTYHDDEANLTITLEEMKKIKVKLGDSEDDDE